jgi:predicted O-methyltransferase YrrM
MKTTLVLTHALEVDGWMTPGELAWLAEAARDASLIIEVGAWKGRSTLALAENTRGVIQVVDPWIRSDGTSDLPSSGFEEFQRNLAPFIARNLTFSREDSLSWVRRSGTHSVADLIFLDGDHTYAHLRREIAAFYGLVRTGGILAGHDYWNASLPDVTRAVDEAFPQGVNRFESIWWVRRA